MLKQGLYQKLKLLQRLSPQQIQFIKLLQVPTAQLEARIKEELMENPALLDTSESEDDNENFNEFDRYDTEDGEYDNERSSKEEGDSDEYEEHNEKEVSLEDYLGDDNFGEDYDYKTYQASDPNEERYEVPVIQKSSLFDLLEQQAGMLQLTEEEELIAHHIIGSIDEDGYLRRAVESITDDLAFRNNFHTTDEQIEKVLRKVQALEPAGIAARDLQECLLLQLYRKEPAAEVQNAIRIVRDCFEEFTRKHFDKMKDKLNLSEEQVKEAYHVITKLNPKPGESQSEVKTHYIIPDFILSVENSELDVKLNRKNAPELRVNKKYREMLRDLEQKDRRNDRESKETFQFVKSKIDAAKWFIDAIKQRQFTLLKTMLCIADKQKDFFLSEGEETRLRPMILKDVADEIGMDISTVSRVANSKYVQTDFGIFQLKFFFSEGISTDSGEEVSNKEIKKILKDLVENESKKKPLSDDALTKILNDKGYQIARRTVAKYREQLDIPVARLRKEI